MLALGISALHKISAFVSLAGWAFGMYYWWVANSSLRPGISRLSLLSPMAYLDPTKFTARGLVARRRVFLSFGVMLVAGLVAWGLRWLLEAHAAA